MICYDRLGETLKKKGLTIYKLQDMLCNYNLRVILNSGRYIELRTLDKICKVLDCKVEDVMEYKEGTQVIKPIVRNRYYILDWGVIDKQVTDRGMTRAEMSVDMGKQPGYLSHLANLKRVTHKAARGLADYLELEIANITVLT